MRRLFVELLDEKKERLARETLALSGIRWLAEKVHVAQWTPVLFGKHTMAHTMAQILKQHEFVQGLSNPSLFVHVERDVRLLVASDYVDHELLTNRFHVTHYAGCAVLFNKDTFYPNVRGQVHLPS